MAEAKRIVMATLGSLGDLNPCVALALELQRRGHQVTIASTEFYRGKVLALGIRFHPIRPRWDMADPELIRRCEDLKRGPEVLFRELVLPELPGMYEDLLAVASDADLMLAGELVFAAPLVAEKLGLRWASIILSPASFFSARDPSVLVNVPWLLQLRRLGWPVYRAALEIGRLGTRHWWEPVRRLRRQQGLRVKSDPIFRDKFSPHLVLALFSRELAQPQVDWPRQTVQPGFVYYDREEAGAGSPAELSAFLDACGTEAPLVFTLGSTAVRYPGSFYEASLAAARQLGRRSVMLGVTPETMAAAAPGADLSSLLAVPYAPYSDVFSRAALVVHQGGSGTTAQVLRVGRPMLVVPYGWDQPDNAARVERRGAGLQVARDEYTAATAVAALARLLEDKSFAQNAASIGESMQTEDGLGAACDAVEALLARH